ncbi:MAG: SH3 domain-containing protein [Polyangiaceae bacterium]
MVANRRDSSLIVEVPQRADDSPRWVNVGIIAAVGFAIGVIWPRLMGVELGPSPPNDARNAAAVTSGASSAARPATSSARTATSANAATSAVPGATPMSANEQTVVVANGVVNKCKDKKGDNLSGAKCGTLDLDSVVLQPLSTLARCPSAVGLAGKIPLTLDVDFTRKSAKVNRNTIKQASLPTTTVNGILSCAEKALANVSIESLQHEHQKYNVVYNLTFYPPGKGPSAGDVAKPGEDDAEKAHATNAVGTQVEVAWPVVQVRDVPKTGGVVGRVLRGVKVKVLAQDKDWYKIEFAPAKRVGYTAEPSVSEPR